MLMFLLKHTATFSFTEQDLVSDFLNTTDGRKTQYLL